jgi:hypothetical protein
MKDAGAPPITLRLTLLAVVTGVLVVIPSPVYLLRIFKSQPSAFASLGESKRVSAKSAEAASRENAMPGHLPADCAFLHGGGPFPVAKADSPRARFRLPCGLPYIG